MTKLHELAELGQSIWYDYIRRDLITSGELETLISMGLRGLTSNPSIFEKAIAHSTEYDEDIKTLAMENRSAMEVYEALALKDIAATADLFRPVHHQTKGLDGYVSLEVSPYLARDTQKTVSEARRLFETLQRPNVMIKVPATVECLPAITELISSGVNVNVTLLFSMTRYKEVAEAFLKGLERLSAQGPSASGGQNLDQVASVASFFLSRVDSAIDKELEKAGRKDLAGKAAVANAKIAYREFLAIFKGSRWKRLHEQGAGPQRLLWGSTGTKNPEYPDTMYVDELIGPNTVNTVPPDTLKSFMDHGKVRETLTRDVDEAEKHLDLLAESGISLEAIAEKLLDDGIVAFAKPFEALIKSIEEKKDRFV